MNELAAPNSPNEDRPWLTADLQTGAVYANLGDLAPRLRHWITASHDQGRTFGAPRAVASNAAREWPASDFVPSAASGVLAVAHVSDAVDPACVCRDVFETSTDDGVTWSRHAAPIPAQWVAADPAHPGRFAVMSGGEEVTDWQSFNPNELLVSVTTDAGTTWSPPAHVGEAPSNVRWMPWIGYAPNGVLGVTYRTKHGTSSCYVPEECSNTFYAEWAAVSADGGFHFAAPVRLSHAVSAAQIPDGSGLRRATTSGVSLSTTSTSMPPGGICAGRRAAPLPGHSAPSTSAGWRCPPSEHRTDPASCD